MKNMCIFILYLLYYLSICIPRRNEIYRGRVCESGIRIDHSLQMYMKRFSMARFLVDNLSLLLSLYFMYAISECPVATLRCKGLTKSLLTANLLEHTVPPTVLTTDYCFDDIAGKGYVNIFCLLKSTNESVGICGW